MVAETGDTRTARTLVVLAHHDAAPTGAVFDQRAQRWFARTFPTVVARIDTSPPLWWPVAGGPWLVALGAALRSRGLLARRCRTERRGRAAWPPMWLAAPSCPGPTTT